MNDNTNNGHGMPTNNGIRSLWLLAVVLVLLLGAAVLSVLFMSPQNHSNNGSDKTTVSTVSNIPASAEIGPCASEDSDNCYRLFGGPDGIGRSFVTINDTIYYLHGANYDN